MTYFLIQLDASAHEHVVLALCNAYAKTKYCGSSKQIKWSGFIIFLSRPTNARSGGIHVLKQTCREQYGRHIARGVPSRARYGNTHRGELYKPHFPLISQEGRKMMVCPMSAFLLRKEAFIKFQPLYIEMIQNLEKRSWPLPK